MVNGRWRDGLVPVKLVKYCIFQLVKGLHLEDNAVIAHLKKIKALSSDFVESEQS